MSFDRHLLSVTLQSRLLERKLSVREAAKEAGVSASTISRLTNGDFLPDIESFAAVVRWLEVDANVFLQTPTGILTKRDRWAWLYLCLQELEVPTELIEAIMTILRLIVGASKEKEQENG